MNRKEVLDKLSNTWDNLDLNKTDLDPAHKFLNRKRTITLNAKRLFQYVPEFLKPKSMILDVSCGSGASLEVIRCAGADGLGLEFSSASKNKKPLNEEYYKDVNAYSDYEPCLISQRLNYIVHDCSRTPYPFEDNSFDLVLNYGAITFYGEPKEWPRILNEFKRISKDTILCGINVGKKWDRGESIVDKWSDNQKDLTLIQKQGSIYKWKFKKS